MQKKACSLPSNSSRGSKSCGTAPSRWKRSSLPISFPNTLRDSTSKPGIIVSPYLLIYRHRCCHRISFGHASLGVDKTVLWTLLPVSSNFLYHTVLAQVQGD